ncbi:cobalamin biosynthesis protein CobD/CbiB [Thalassotalea sp. PLHSN55]|uniref:cobalamin biosynthesis protein CobD/CbiB n=1 Tax=Thalassotalea sp. PLHSN55 TaxID=3435888 RepID=UPI003F86847A
MTMPLLSLTLLFALLLDYWLGEPKKYHPLVGFGHLANRLAGKVNVSASQANKSAIIKGALSWVLLVMPLPVLCYYFINALQTNTLFTGAFANHQTVMVFFLEAVIVYWALGYNSLKQHGMQIYQALVQQNLADARKYCGYIVSRETAQLDEQAISRCTTESMLENSNDAVTATLILFILGGAPLVILHRLANTLDAMWGYKNTQFYYFGRCAARADDVLAFIPAKITSFAYAILGLRKALFTRIIINAAEQAKAYKSHNGGWVMAAGATLLQVRLGNANAIYHGKVVHSPLLGEGDMPQARHIKDSLNALKHVIVLMLIFCFFGEWLYSR